MSIILFINDDADILEVNARYFTKEGCNIRTFSNSRDVLHIIKNFHPDCNVLDIMMLGTADWGYPLHYQLSKNTMVSYGVKVC